MKALKQATKKSGKIDKERSILFGLIEHYIVTGKAVGSNVLKESGFENMSSATIRNYFAHLEEEGYLTQQHTSGGRIPTESAFRLYAHTFEKEAEQEKIPFSFFNKKRETREIISLLQHAAEELATHTKTAVFLSAPRFEQDFIIAIKPVIIDASCCLCVLITDFGDIRTEMLYTEHKFSTGASKRLEAYFTWRLTGNNKPENMNKDEEDLAQKLYNELIVRYIVGYSQFNEEDVYRTGFSSLLTYPEFQDPSTLAGSLSLFENTQGMRLLLKECSKFDQLKFWIGQDLANYSTQPNIDCAIVAIPYYVNHKPVGAVGVFGPLRLPYRFLFNALRQFSDHLSKALTECLYKFKITMRQPKTEWLNNKAYPQLLNHVERPLLEHHEKNPERRK